LVLVMEGLARAPEAVAPPPARKQRVLASLEATVQAGSSRPVEAGFSQPVEAGFSRPADAPVEAGSSRTLPLWNPWLAVAAAVIVAAGIALYFGYERETHLASELERLAGDMTELQGRLDDNAAQADMVLSILIAPDMRRIELAPGDGSQSTARAYWSPTRGLLVAADRLPVPPPGRIYQVWLIGSGAPVSAGLLGTPSNGRGMLIAPPPSGISGGPVTVAITDEPPGGLAAPTGGKHLIGSL
jgi:anti-sigma-K factor RskA